ncbi:uncharacterized protein LOC118002489 [Mirounga leonina]|uniref:uncharacterized protein LOC118002489 n=1 Tax=Mirounga leonina TaxID=9715 RepID=UPI00156C3C61|nr:uncharacterized protein LOC118002489 [Mirounga leonina]
MPKPFNGKTQSFQQMVLGKLGICMQGPKQGAGGARLGAALGRLRGAAEPALAPARPRPRRRRRACGHVGSRAGPGRAGEAGRGPGQRSKPSARALFLLHAGQRSAGRPEFEARCGILLPSGNCDKSLNVSERNYNNYVTGRSVLPNSCCRLAAGILIDRTSCIVREGSASAENSFLTISAFRRLLGSLSSPLSAWCFYRQHLATCHSRFKTKISKTRKSFPQQNVSVNEGQELMKAHDLCLDEPNRPSLDAPCLGVCDNSSDAMTKTPETSLLTAIIWCCRVIHTGPESDIRRQVTGGWS